MTHFEFTQNLHGADLVDPRQHPSTSVHCFSIRFVILHSLYTDLLLLVIDFCAQIGLSRIWPLLLDQPLPLSHVICAREADLCERGWSVYGLVGEADLCERGQCVQERPCAREANLCERGCAVWLAERDHMSKWERPCARVDNNMNVILQIITGIFH